MSDPSINHPLFLPQAKNPRFLIAAGLAVPLAMALMGSDHRDGPATTADRAADIADLYAFHDLAADKLTTVLTFAGLGAPGNPAVYDKDVLFTINIDTNADQTPEFSILIRFSQNAAGETAAQIENLPGTSGPVTGLVDNTSSTTTGQKVFVGKKDDPFFFDLDGFHMSLDKLAGDNVLKFVNTRDFFAGTNVSAVVLEMKLSDVTADGTNPNLQIWATSGRQLAVTSIPSLHDNLAFVAKK